MTNQMYYAWEKLMQAVRCLALDASFDERLRKAAACFIGFSEYQLLEPELRDRFVAIHRALTERLDDLGVEERRDLASRIVDLFIDVSQDQRAHP